MKRNHHQVSSLVLSLMLCQMVNSLPALTLPATITVNAASGGGGGGNGVGGGSAREGGLSSSNLDAISSSLGSNMQAAAQQLINGDTSTSQNGGQLNVGSLGGGLNVEGLTGLSTSSVSGLGTNGLGLTSGGLRTFSLNAGNGAGISSNFGATGSNGGDLGSSSSVLSLDAENLSQGGIQQRAPLFTSFAARVQGQNDGFDGSRQFFPLGGRPGGFSRSTANAVPQNSWVIDVNSLGDTTSAPNSFPVNQFRDQSSWSTRQQANIQSPNYLPEYNIQPRTGSTPSVYYTVADAQTSNSPLARSYSVRGGDGLQLQYARNGGGAYGGGAYGGGANGGGAYGGGAYGGPITGQGYYTSGLVVPALQSQLGF